VKRRAFISMLGGALASWPLAARAQQNTMPVVGFLSPRAADDAPQLMAAFRQGLKEAGFIENQNVAIEYRFAGNQHDRLPALADDLVRRQVTVIAALTTAASVAAKAATMNIPIVFETASDPIRLGLVGSLNRPGGNLTGVTQLNVEIAPKLLEFLHELVPTARVMALLVNPDYPALAEPQSRAMLSAASKFGLELHVLNASSEDDFDAVFENLNRLRAGGLVISVDTVFDNVGGAASTPGNLQLSAVRHGRRADVLWTRHCRYCSTFGFVCRSHSQGREAGRPSGTSANQVRVGYQP
jgi:putative tryptophan/tyrosine transport system substrate-binding protein